MRQFVPGVICPPAAEAAEPLWYLVRGSELLVAAGDDGAVLPSSEIARDLTSGAFVHYLGALDGRPCFAAEVPAGTEPPDGHRFVGLRALYGLLDDDLHGVGGRAVQVVDWDRTNQFCGRCGEPMAFGEGERSKRCPRCGLTNFPRLAPAVITLVEREDEVLLARGANFQEGFYSTLAGFVEPGESLEQTVEREIFEEVGVRVDRIRYFGSQPWPYPHSLMIGFTAAYAGGEITIDPVEIADARWFRATDMPKIPGKLSIARALIDDYLTRSGVDVA